MSNVQTPHSYGMQVHLDNVPYEQAVEKITAALKEQGFGILSNIDVKATLKAKLDADFRPYVILGACNPPLAKRALESETEIGLLLPCNVIVYSDETGEGSVVSAADPQAMLGIVNKPELEEIAEEAKNRINKALSSL